MWEKNSLAFECLSLLFCASLCSFCQLYFEWHAGARSGNCVDWQLKRSKSEGRNGKSRKQWIINSMTFTSLKPEIASALWLNESTDRHTVESHIKWSACHLCDRMKAVGDRTTECGTKTMMRSLTVIIEYSLERRTKNQGHNGNRLLVRCELISKTTENDFIDGNKEPTNTFLSRCKKD